MGTLYRLLSSAEPFVSDGGMETDLIFHQGADLPLFASFVLLDTAEGRELLRNYALSYLDMAQEAGRGIVLGTPTWRANGGWGPKLGYTEAGIREVNRRAVTFIRQLRDAHLWKENIVIEGVLGPAGDGYTPEQLYEPSEAARLHSAQLEAFAETGVDIATAFTITHPGEAIGMINRARELGLHFALSLRPTDACRPGRIWPQRSMRSKRQRAGIVSIMELTAPILNISWTTCRRAG